MARERSFLIHLGAQKAGSTWLWHYFLEHPQCSVTPLKELHFFTRKVARLHRELDEVNERIQNLNRTDDPEVLERTRQFIEHFIEVLERPVRTEQDFEELVSWGADEDARLVAEFTPANGMLSSERIRKMAALQSNPRFLMVLRDPVDRVWSQIRMQAVNARMNGETAEGAATRLLETFVACKTDLKPERYDYGTMLRRAQKLIPKERLFVDFFETFMCQERISKLCEFLEIDFMPAKLDEPRMVGNEMQLSQENRKRLCDVMRWQYREVERRLGNLPDRWYETLAL